MTISTSNTYQFASKTPLETELKTTPRLHQEEAIHGVLKGLKKQDRGQLIMPCGTGKTLTSIWIRERIKAGRTLVLLPSLNLLSQTLKEWEKKSEEALNWIAVCSDKTVAKQDEDADEDADEWVVNASDLGIPVTNEVQAITDFLVNSENGVIFSTYHSAELISEAQQDAEIPHFDLAIADEAHRLAGKVSKSFGTILDSKKIRSSKRLFMTATPRVLTQKVKNKANRESIHVACMDDKSKFGKVLFEMKFSEAINRNLLCDYKVIVVGVDSPTVHNEINNNSVISNISGQIVDSKTLANHIALSKAINDYSLNRVITFHGRVKGAEDFASNHLQITKHLNVEILADKANVVGIKTGFVSGDMTTKDRTKQLNKLREIKGNEVSILSNARCLSEGVDVPILDAVAFIDPRKSVVDIIQSVGRAIRKANNKTHGYIILPVFLGDCEDVNDAILSSKFKEIFKVILALKSQDDTLSDVLDNIRIDSAKGGKISLSSQLKSKIIFDLPQGIPTGFRESLTTLLVQNTTDSWMGHYGELKKFVEENGHALVNTEQHSLGGWVTTQRTYMRKGLLAQDKIDLLEEIGFIWSVQDSEWWRNYQSAHDYFIQNGHLNVLRSDKKNTKLYNWIVGQRSSRWNSQGRINLLNSIGFIWDTDRPKWEEKYNLYLQDPKSKRSRGWAYFQRDNYRKGNLKQYKIDLLNKVNFDWNPPLLVPKKKTKPKK